MRPMTAGLSADCAILDFQSGNIESALALMLRALMEAEPIDPNAGLRERYISLILITAILWMRGAAADWPVERQAVLIGMCSNPDPSPEFKDRPLPQRLFSWYELAELEAETSDSHVILKALRQRTAKSGSLLNPEIMLASRLITGALRTLDVDRFIDALVIYPRAVVEGLALMRRGDFDVFAMPEGELQPITAGEWSEKDISEAATSAVLIFLLTATCSGQPEIIERVQARLMKKEGLGSSLAPLFDTISEPSERRDDLNVGIASILGRMLQPGFVFDAAEAFMAMIFIVQLLSSHILGETAAGPVFEYFADVWRDILSNRTFSVRNPAATSPFILAAALSKRPSNRAKLAELVLASEAAVRPHLSDDLRGRIRALTEERRTPLSELQAPRPSGQV
jgi:hypothetical protein